MKKLTPILQCGLILVVFGTLHFLVLMNNQMNNFSSHFKYASSTLSRDARLKDDDDSTASNDKDRDDYGDDYSIRDGLNHKWQISPRTVFEEKARKYMDKETSNDDLTASNDEDGDDHGDIFGDDYNNDDGDDHGDDYSIRPGLDWRIVPHKVRFDRTSRSMNKKISTAANEELHIGTEEEDGAKDQPLPDDSLVENSEVQWEDNVCDSIEDSVCWEVFVVENRKVTFCSAAKVASTTTKQYFYDIADGEIIIPDGAQYGVHEANWKDFRSLDNDARKHVLTSPEWTHIFFWRHVVERFVSGYLDKVVNDCPKDPTDKPDLAIYHYIQYGFSCEEHQDLESFVSFMETVPIFEGHFAAQTPLCNLEKFPFTDIIEADENLDLRLQGISSKLNTEHPMKKEETVYHQTGAKDKMIALFKGKTDLIYRILRLFKEDCIRLPKACYVEDFIAALKE